ncbi:MAG: hypothetical protein B6I36_07075 [Desulfobacteraceae bacterium 4572_35.1]|nr:MAG: hypothetical protein B6I36_07075 [Desulfobacteraceae bacterium 4572_35.1]
MLAKLSRRIKKQRILRKKAVAECDHFFFYGSLMERFSNFNRHLKKDVCSIEIGYCQGYLYNLPVGFPGLIVPEKPCPTLVAGEIMRFHNPRRIMKMLDRLEGYLPHNERKSTYLRRKMTLICEDKTVLGEQRKIDAWVYIYPEHHLSYEHHCEVHIECGQWKTFSTNKYQEASTQKQFNPLSQCNKTQQVIVATALRRDTLFSQKLHPPSCHDLCKNSATCGWQQTPHPNSDGKTL